MEITRFQIMAFGLEAGRGQIPIPKIERTFEKIEAYVEDFFE